MAGFTPYRGLIATGAAAIFVKGAGDMRFILLTHLVVAPLPVCLAWVGIEYYDAGVIWCWFVVTAWILVLGLIFMARFLQGRWKEMRVIEPELISERAIDIDALRDESAEPHAEPAAIAAGSDVI